MTCEYRCEWWQSIAGRRVRRHRLCGQRAVTTIVYIGTRGLVSRKYCVTHKEGEAEHLMAAVEVRYQPIAAPSSER